MTLFIRDKNNKTLFELETWVATRPEEEGGGSYSEISTSIDVKNYSLHLLHKVEPKEQVVFTYVFDELSNLRGWLWESYYMTGDNDGSDQDKIVDKLKHFLREVASRFNLLMIED